MFILESTHSLYLTLRHIYASLFCHGNLFLFVFFFFLFVFLVFVFIFLLKFTCEYNGKFSYHYLYEFGVELTCYCLGRMPIINENLFSFYTHQKLLAL